MNANIRDMVGVVPIKDKMRKNRLRWFEHIYRKSTNVVVRKNDRIIDNENTRGRGRGRSTLTLDAVVKRI